MSDDIHAGVSLARKEAIRDQMTMEGANLDIPGQLVAHLVGRSNDVVFDRMMLNGKNMHVCEVDANDSHFHSSS